MAEQGNSLKVSKKSFQCQRPGIFFLSSSMTEAAQASSLVRAKTLILTRAVLEAGSKSIKKLRTAEP